MLSPELIAKIRKIQIHAKHIVQDALAGQYRSAFKGRGMEFDEVREYFAGDDVRSIDWNVTARAGKPFVKLFKDEREQTVMLVVDVSGSTQFGSRDRNKNEIAAEFAAMLAYTAIKGQDKVGLLIFSDHIEHYIPPKKGRAHVWQIIGDILSHKPKSKKTELASTLEHLARILKKKSIVFIVSDFIDSNTAKYEKPLKRLISKHSVTLVDLYDPRERQTPDVGYIEAEDAESGEVQVLRIQQRSDVRDPFKTLEQKRLRTVELGTEMSTVDVVTKMLRERKK